MIAGLGGTPSPLGGDGVFQLLAVKDLIELIFLDERIQELSDAVKEKDGGFNRVLLR